MNPMRAQKIQGFGGSGSGSGLTKPVKDTMKPKPKDDPQRTLDDKVKTGPLKK